MANLMEEVRKGHSRGWSFTPLGGDDGKKPILLEWPKLPRETLDQATAWARAGNIGLRTGRNSGVIVVDVDRLELPTEMPRTVTVRTGRGKFHLYYRLFGPWGNQKLPLGPSIDIRGDGGQVVFPGSKNLQTGGEYDWVPGLSPDEVELAEFPIEDFRARARAWAAELRAAGKSVAEIATEMGVSKSIAHKYLTDTSRANVRANESANVRANDPNLPTTSGRYSGSVGANVRANDPGRSRERSRASRWAEAALTNESESVSHAAEGTRNSTLNTAAFNLGQLVAGGYLDRDLVERVLAVAAVTAGLGAEETRKTIASGLAAGMQQPRRLPDPPPPASRRPPAPPRRSVPSPPVTPSLTEYVLIPGPHIDHHGVLHEVGTNSFADEVVSRLPPDLLYRQDFVPGQLVGVPGKRRFAPLAPAQTRILVDGHMRLGRWVEVKQGENKGDRFALYISCTDDMAKVVQAHASNHEGVRELRFLTNYPVFRPDWTVAQAGWQEGVYYDEPEDLRDLNPEMDPETIQVVLEDLLIDFPFSSEADRQNMIGLLLTPIVRPAIHGNVPLHLILSTLERTGKTKLAEQVLGRIVRGEPVPGGTLPHSEEEQEKRITSLLLAGETLFHLDNMREYVDSAVLASLLTASTYTGRMLGVSRQLKLPNTVTLVATGNNVRATGELVKRTVPICLQPASDAPEDRDDFYHPDLPGYLRDVRRRVLECLLGMVILWVEAGRPSHGKKLGGFEEWSESVGGIMAVCGFTEWRKNERQWRRDADPRGEDLRALVGTWWETYRALPLSTADLMKIATDLGIFPDCFTSQTEKGKLTTFSKRVLTPHTNTPVGGFIIRRDGSSSNARYKLEQTIFGGVS